MRGGLARRTVLTGILLVLIGAAAFGVVLSSVADLHESERRLRPSQEVLVVANHLERLVVDLETGLRGYLITGQSWPSTSSSAASTICHRPAAACGRAAQPRVLGGVGGLALSVLLIAVFVVAEYLTIIRPLRQAATMAQRLALGDLGAPLPDQGVGEIGVLERSFNTMASSHALGGAISIASPAGQGTTLTLTMPISGR